MNIILGIDPGYNTTGYGLIKVHNNELIYILSGSIKTKKIDFFLKLKKIYNNIYFLIKKLNPNNSVIEKIFIGKNMDSSLKLCHARSAIILALTNLNIPIYEYTSKQVKKNILFNNYSNKNYTKQYIKNFFNLSYYLNSDESDALSIVITHCYINKIIK